MARAAARGFFRRSGVKPFPFRLSVSGGIPVSRGLGSSAALRAGTVLGLNALAGAPLDLESVHGLVTRLEGHPDNAAPALFGGGHVVCEKTRIRLPVGSKLRVVLLVPDLEISTARARALLPPRIDRRAAVASAGNLAIIVAALALGEYALMRGHFDDGLHQPFRLPLVPFLPRVLRAGERAGALGGFLSGSGSAIACLTLENAEMIGRAMRHALPAGMKAEVMVTAPENRGARIVRKR